MNNNLNDTVDPLTTHVVPAKVVDNTDDEILNYTRTARMAIAADMGRDGPPQGKDRRIFFELLNDLDRGALDSKRLDLDKSQGANENEVARLAIRVQERAAKAAELLKGQVPIDTSNARPPEVDESLLPEVTPVDDEFNQDQITEDYDTFTARHSTTQKS